MVARNAYGAAPLLRRASFHAYFHQTSFFSVTLASIDTISKSLPSAGCVALAFGKSGRELSGASVLEALDPPVGVDGGTDAALFDSAKPMNCGRPYFRESRFCSSIACVCRIVATVVELVLFGWRASIWHDPVRRRG
jgi:hypothetical protein